MIRVLIILGSAMDYGGTESFLMNYSREFSNVQFDFVVPGYEKGVYDDEILSRGGKIYHVPYKNKHPIGFSKQIADIIRKNHYQIVHAQIDAMNAWPLEIARREDVPVRISHSHNTDIQSTNLVKRAINNFTKKHIAIVATELWACSHEAGVWLYGKKMESVFKVIHNAIDLERYHFDSNNRIQIRNTFHVNEDIFLIGHVGRFAEQKNHVFLIKCFYELVQLMNNVALMLVGDGQLKEATVELTKTLGISDKVLFVGNVNDVEKYYSAMDLFAFPSKFEGLSITFLEVQANGLHSICSEGVTEEGCVANVERLDVSLGAKYWAKRMASYYGVQRTNNDQVLRDNGFDLKFESHNLESEYQRLACGQAELSS